MNRREALAAVVTAVVLTSACAARSRQHDLTAVDPRVAALCAAQQDCTMEIGRDVRLSTLEACVLPKYQSRCTVRDRCVVKCLVSGGGSQSGRNCLGDCQHLQVVIDDASVDCPREYPPSGYKECDPWYGEFLN
jgi:hypothetical protein